MIRMLTMVASLLVLAAPSSAQAPPGWKMRLDERADAADPDDVPEVSVVLEGNGFRISTGPAVVLWNADNMATGEYTVRGTFTMLEPSDHRNYYGLVFGGSELEGPGQSYLYFLVAQDGSFLVRHRSGNDQVEDVVSRTAHEAVRVPDAAGRATNELEVRVLAANLEFAVNGTVVHTASLADVPGRTDGLWGVRVNHRLPGILVEGLALRKR